MTELAPHSPPRPPDVPAAPAMASIPVGELENLRARANRLRVLSRTLLGVVGILGLATVLIVALALLLD